MYQSTINTHTQVNCKTGNKMLNNLERSIWTFVSLIFYDSNCHLKKKEKFIRSQKLIDKVCHDRVVYGKQAEDCLFKKLCAF